MSAQKTKEPEIKIYVALPGIKLPIFVCSNIDDINKIKKYENPEQDNDPNKSFLFTGIKIIADEGYFDREDANILSDIDPDLYATFSDTGGKSAILIAGAVKSPETDDLDTDTIFYSTINEVKARANYILSVLTISHIISPKQAKEAGCTLAFTTPSEMPPEPDF